jgi:hypothetical protein
MDHSEDANGLTSEFVDQAVTIEEAFAHVWLRVLRYDAPEPGLCGQFVGEVEQAFDNLLSVVTGVSADVLGDAIDVIERFVRQIRA